MFASTIGFDLTSFGTTGGNHTVMTDFLEQMIGIIAAMHTSGGVDVDTIFVIHVERSMNLFLPMSIDIQIKVICIQRVVHMRHAGGVHWKKFIN